MKFNFKKSLAASLVVLSFLTSCKKDNDTQVTTPPPGNNGGNNNNNGNVKPEAVGKWLHGTFAMAEYWAYDGSYQGNPFSQSIAFDFKADGTYEMYYAGETNNFGCIADAFSYYKGYVTFTDSSFITHPLQGRFRGYYNCAPANDFDRPASTSELHVQAFYYHFETDSNNKKWLVVGFTPNDQYPSYFEATTW